VRPVKNARKARGTVRGKTNRANRRISRLKQASQPSFSWRRQPKDNRFVRIVRAVGRWFGRPIMLLIAALGAFVLVAGLFAGGYVGRGLRTVSGTVDAVSADAGFGIAEVHISGNTRTPPETVAAALGLEPGQSIFAADLNAARRRLMGLDWIAEADVRRRYPDSIYVTIVEKLPFALWQSPNGLFVVERSGALITNKNLEAFASLPKFIGAGANGGADVVDAIAAHRAVSARVRAIERISNRRWNLILDGDVVVKLPEAGWPKQIDMLEHLIVDKGILERDISEIDLRNSASYFFVLKNQKKDDGGKPI
jgi:cell division protein FtsQ